jgi:nicotinamidase/pyrazinamidase
MRSSSCDCLGSTTDHLNERWDPATRRARRARGRPHALTSANRPDPARYPLAMLRYRPGVALIVVDVQNDFADPNGSLSVRGGADLVPVINREAALAASNGGIVAFTQDWHPEHTPHFAKDGGIWPDHCIAGTWGAEFYPALEVPAGAPIVHKGANGEDGYSGFSMRDPTTGETIPTELDGLLRAAGVTEVIVTGLATDYCTKATALDAVRLGYATTVLTDAIAAVDLQPGDGERSLGECAAAGVLLRSSRAR